MHWQLAEYPKKAQLACSNVHHDLKEKLLSDLSIRAHFVGKGFLLGATSKFEV